MQNEELIKWPFLKQTWGIEFEKSDGMYLYTKEGQKILDAAGGAIVSNIGYGREDVAEAVADLSLIHISEPTRHSTISSAASDVYKRQFIYKGRTKNP